MLVELEIDGIFKKIPEGVLLNEKIIENNDLYKNTINLISQNYEEQERKYLLFILKLL